MTSALLAGGLAMAMGLATLAAPTPAPAHAASLPPEVVDQLERQAAALARVYLEYTETQAGMDLPDYYGGPTAYAAYFDDNRFYLRTDMHYRQPDQHVVHEDAFDGRYFYYAEKTYGDLIKYLPSDETDPDRLDPLYFRYFEAAGFYPPQSVADVDDSSAIQSLVLQYLEKGSGTTVEKKEGHLCVTVQIPDPLVIRARATDVEKKRKKLSRLKNGPEYVEQEIETLRKTQAQLPNRKVIFFLDPNRGYGVVAREEYTAAGQKIVRVQAEDWQRHEEAGIWLPALCIETYYADRFALKDFSDQPRLTVAFKLNRVEFTSHKDIPFTLTQSYKKPGTIVFDRTTPEARRNPGHAVVYHVAASGKLLRGSAVKAAREMSRRMRYFLIGAVVILTLPPIAMFMQHRRKLLKG